MGMYYRADIYKHGETWICKTIKANSLDTLNSKLIHYINDDKCGLIEVYHVNDKLCYVAKYPNYFDDELINAIKGESKDE